MDPRLDDESRVVATMARNSGIFPYSLSPFWNQIMPLFFVMGSGGLKLNCWHHRDFGTNQEDGLLGPC